MEGTPDIPPAPPAPRRPWIVLISAGVVSFAALQILISLAKGDTTVPPGWLFAASGIVTAGVGGIAVWLAAMQSSLVPPFRDRARRGVRVRGHRQVQPRPARVLPNGEQERDPDARRIGGIEATSPSSVVCSSCSSPGSC
jgi:hypothetical protein